MQQYLEFAQTLARQAGEIMLKHFQIGVAADIKSDRTPVTLADHEINQLVIDEIAKAYPGHSVLAEEGSRLKPGAKYTWVCDPIDGTIPYAFGVPTNTFALALVNREGQPVMAVLYDPHTDRLFSAIKGAGAVMNGEPIHVNDIDDFDDAYIGNSSRRSDVVDAYELKVDLVRACHRIFMFSSSSYEGLLVAAGQIAATVYMGPHAHDGAAIKLMVEEAGGKVTDLFGQEQRYDEPIKGLIVSNGQIHNQLVAIAQRHRL